MGDIVLLTDEMPDLLPMLNRSPGVHISTIIHDLCIRLGYFEDDGRRPVQVWMELGNALEHAIIARLQREFSDRYVEPGELERDGLFGTPDLLDTQDYAIEEIKLAWMSSNHKPDSEKFWRYWTQIKAYCWMAETELSRLHVCHVNGAYRNAGPVYHVWEQRFTQEELEENWRMLKTHAERYLG